MIKKEIEQVKARHLRKKGNSIKEIGKILHVANSSVSNWVRDVKLTKKQIKFLKHKSHLKEVIKKRVETRLRNENARRRTIIENHKKTISKLTINKEHLLLMGTCLYWAEGGKSERNRIFRFSNSDPSMIKVIMPFIKNVCEIPRHKLHGHIHLHPHLDTVKAEKYWSKVSGIPTSQFYKTSQSHNKRSSNTRDTLPFGTFNVEICSTDLFLKMKAWTEVIIEKTTQPTS
ncbi:MAG: hypothetical protein Q8R34_00510 [bacterium]|nr:hypothetical protein [bacterium]